MTTPTALLHVWRHFRGVPMETLTKAWWFAECGGAPRQRTVAEMRAHRARFGCGGNCFDLSLWILAALADAGIPARAVGHDWETPDAHIALVARVDGVDHLCDLGDQWLRPIPLSTVTPGWLGGFFPGAKVRLEPDGTTLRVRYRFPDGREDDQTYDLSPATPEAVDRACRHSQSLLRKPLVEVLGTNPETGEAGAWEFDRFRSFWRLPSGRRPEAPCADLAGWARRICDRSGISTEVALQALQVYAARQHA